MRDCSRESAMVLTSHTCKNQGHRTKDCKQLTKKSDKLSSNLENDGRKWWPYYRSNGHLNEDCYQQQSEPKSANLDNKKKYGNYHKSGSHSDNDCYHQRDGKPSSTADTTSKKRETFVADSTMTGCDNKQCSYNSRV